MTNAVREPSLLASVLPTTSANLECALDIEKAFAIEGSFPARLNLVQALLELLPDLPQSSITVSWEGALRDILQQEKTSSWVVAATRRDHNPLYRHYSPFSLAACLLQETDEAEFRQAKGLKLALLSVILEGSFPLEKLGDHANELRKNMQPKNKAVIADLPEFQGDFDTYVEKLKEQVKEGALKGDLGKSIRVLLGELRVSKTAGSDAIGGQPLRPSVPPTKSTEAEPRELGPYAPPGNFDRIRVGGSEEASEADPPAFVDLVSSPRLQLLTDEPEDEITRRLDEEQADAQLKASKHWLRRHDNLVPTDYTRFTPLERAQLAEAIKADLTAKGSQYVVAGLIGCIYVLGMPLDMLLTTATRGENAVFDLKGRYIKEVRRPEGAFTPTDQQIKYFEKTISKITFQLPNLITEWLVETHSKGAATLGLCLGITEEEARQKVKGWLEQFRQNTSLLRVRIERIQAALPIELMLAHRDPALTWHIAGRDNQAAPMLAYYVAYPEKQLVSAYNQTASFMLLEKPLANEHSSNLRIGYYPAAAIKDKFVFDLSKRIDEAMRHKSIAVRHNAITDYSLALFFAAMGHRPVTDPFYSSSLFSLEKGYILISDKTHVTERDWRLVALPERARQVLEIYKNYLDKVPAWLANSGDYMLSAEVAQLCKHNEMPSLPLFFYLDEEAKSSKIRHITPSMLTQRWAELWPLPTNMLRHMLAEALACGYGRSDYAQIQLGHFMGYDHPFGSAASFSAQEVLGQMNQAIQEHLVNSGWQVKQIPLRLPKNSEDIAVDELPTLPIYEGPERFQKRKDKEKHRQSLVRLAIKHVLNNSKKISSQDEITKIEQYIVEHSDSNANQYLRVLYRYLWRLPGGKKLLASHGLKRALDVENSPYNESSITQYSRLIKVRQKFLDGLEDLYKKEITPSITESVSEVVISSALFGGIADPIKLKALPQALLTNTYAHLEKLLVEIPLSDKTDEPVPVFRWFPDPITHLLINGFFVRHGKCISEASKDDLRSGIDKALSKKMRALDLSSASQKPYQVLAEVVLPGIAFEAPGHLYGFLSGATLSASIPHHAWVRAHSDRALKLESLEEQHDSLSVVQGLEINLSAPADEELLARTFNREIRQIFTEIEKRKPTGSIKVSNSNKREIVSKIGDILTNREAPWPINCQLIASWAIYLCKSGTRYSTSVSDSTVIQYVRLISKRILEAQPAVSLLDMDSADLESFYQDILEKEPGNLRLAGRLIEFHAFLEQAYVCDPVEWNSILSGAYIKGMQSYPDANFISESEYLRIIELLSDHASFDEQLRLQLIALMVFGYRFNLRFGEAYKLLHRDIQVHKGQITVDIRCNLFAENKTSSSRRWVPQLEDFSALENEVINKVVSAASVAAEKDKLAPIFFASQGERDLERRSLLSSVLGKTIKAVTGDSSTRFHHLRHSWATRMYAFAFHKNGFGSSSLASTSINGQWWADFIGHHAAQNPLSSISVAMGHSSESTTLYSYIHSIDLGACQLYKLEDYKVSNATIAYALGGISDTVARQRKSRGSLYVLDKNIPTTSVQLVAPIKNLKAVLTSNIRQQLTLLKVEQILSRLMVRQGDIYTVSEELIVSPELIRQVLDKAARQEGISGFDYYNADAISWGIETSKPSVFNKQDDAIHALMSETQPFIDQMTAEAQAILKDSLWTWAETFYENRHIVSDSQARTHLTWLAENLLFTTVESIKERSSDFKVRMVEKSKFRRSIGETIRFNKTERLKTFRAINRFLFVLLVYMSLESTE